MLVARDTLEVPTYRHESFPAYQSGREFDDDLLEQLEGPTRWCSLANTHFGCGVPIIGAPSPDEMAKGSRLQVRRLVAGNLLGPSAI